MGDAWTIQSVAAILANPRYTGRQVWNRQRLDRDPSAIDGVFGQAGHDEVQRWNPALDRVISEQAVHEALVSEQDFITVQAIRAARPAEDGSTRTYLLAGLLRCGVCLRRMDGHWVHDRPGYRCRHGHSSARSADAARPKNLYVREDHALAKLAELRLGRGGSAPEDLFPPEIIVVAVRWYPRFDLSYRDVGELLVERGVEVDHVTLYRWVQRFTPLPADAARFARRLPGDRWFVGETYVKVNGVWRYVSRAVDRCGQVVDVLVSARRDGEAARRFFRRAPAALKVTPTEVVTDAAAVYPRRTG